eukprot:9235511-Prorocentrum_lima.AAC.1
MSPSCQDPAWSASCCQCSPHAVVVVCLEKRHWKPPGVYFQRVGHQGLVGHVREQQDLGDRCPAAPSKKPVSVDVAAKQIDA